MKQTFRVSHWFESSGGILFLQVSTIIPAYNAEEFIREAVDSVLAQMHREQEIIVVDDGSAIGTRTSFS